MKRSHIRIIVILLIIIAIISLIKYCIPEKKEKEKPSVKNNHNITLFLDLSDHLDETEYSTKVFNKYRYEAFTDAAKIFGECYVDFIQKSGKPLVTYNENFQISSHPQGTFDIDSYLSNSKIELNKNNLGDYLLENKNVIPDTLVKNVAGIIDQCRRTYNGSGKWPGSDTYSFIEDKSNYYVEGKKNLLIIFTDGYPFHEDLEPMESKWFLGDSPAWKKSLHGKTKLEVRSFLDNNANAGLESATQGLEHLSVLVIGTMTQGHNNSIMERDLISELWKNWFVKMGVNSNNVQVISMEECTTNKLQNTYEWLLKSQ